MYQHRRGEDPSKPSSTLQSIWSILAPVLQAVAVVQPDTDFDI